MYTNTLQADKKKCKTDEDNNSHRNIHVLSYYILLWSPWTCFVPNVYKNMSEDWNIHVHVYASS